MAKKKQNNGWLYGLLSGGAVLTIIFLVKALFDIVYRDAVAHLYPLSKILWAIFGGASEPNTIAYVIITIIILGPATYIGHLVTPHFKKGDNLRALSSILVLLIFWIVTFYLLSRPMTPGMHH